MQARAYVLQLSSKAILANKLVFLLFPFIIIIIIIIIIANIVFLFFFFFFSIVLNLLLRQFASSKRAVKSRLWLGNFSDSSPLEKQTIGCSPSSEFLRSFFDLLQPSFDKASLVTRICTTSCTRITRTINNREAIARSEAIEFNSCQFRGFRTSRQSTK